MKVKAGRKPAAKKGKEGDHRHRMTEQVIYSFGVQ
jgi:hypothetical protein